MLRPPGGAPFPDPYTSVAVTVRARLAAFGPGYEDASANPRVFIGQVRRKIESDPAHPQRLLTEAGVGYRFHPG